MKSGEVVFIIKSIVHYAFSMDMGQYENESLNAHYQNIGIMFKVEFQTSFWHSRITYLKKL